MVERLRKVETEISRMTGYRVRLIKKNALKQENLLVKGDPNIG